MNVVYASESEIPSESANSIQVIRMCDAFVDNGCNVKLLGFASDVGAGAEGGATHEQIKSFYGAELDLNLILSQRPTNRIGRWLYGRHVARQSRLARADLVFARCAYSALACCRANLEVIYECHAIPRSSSNLYRRVLPKLFSHKNLKHVISISNCLRTDLLGKFAVHEQKITAVHDGANLLGNVSVVTEEDAFFKSLQSPIVGYTGSLHRGKGIELIVPLAKVLPEISFVIAGGPDSFSQDLKTDNRDVKNLYFLGHQTPASVSRLLGYCDIVLLPNQVGATGAKGVEIGRWTSPLKAFEYMAAKRTIIASNLPVLREVFKSGENCLLCEPNQVTDWKNAILRLTNDIRLRESLATNAYNDFCRNHTWTQRVAEILKIANYPA